MGLIAMQPSSARCAIYVRVSPKPEGAVGDNYSIASQLHDLKGLVLKEFQCSEPDVYIDKDASGATLNRPELERLRDNIAAKLYERGGIAAYSPDRWSRELVDTLILDGEVKKGGARMLYCSGNYEATPEGDFARDAQALVAKYERAKLKERSRRCRRQKSREGHVHSCHAPDGYKYEGHKFGKRGEYVEVPERAKVVKVIFVKTAEGMTNSQLAKWLNAKGIKTQKGNRWYRNSVFQVLEHRCYYGEMVQNGETIKVPVIVSRELWERAHEALRRHKIGKVGRPPNQYLLTGMLWCRRCGERCTTLPNHGTPAYRCGNLDNADRNIRFCLAPQVLKKHLEPVIWNAVWDTVCNPLLLWQMVEEYYERVAGRPKAKDPGIVRIDKARRVLARAEQILADPDQPVPYAQAKANVEAARRELATAQMQVPAEVIALPKRKDVDAISASFRAMRNELEVFEDRREALQLLVAKIFYEDREAEIHCHLPAASEKNCHHGARADGNSFGSIPFIINVRVAA